MRISYFGLATVLAAAAPGVADAGPRAENWTGCYAGASGGYEFHGRSVQSNKVDVAGNLFTAQGSDIVTKGGVGGLELGCNVQASNFVIGPELAASYQDVKGTSDTANLRSPGETIRAITKSNYLATGSVRLGYSLNRLLVYGRGGIAATTFKHSGYIFDGSGAVVDVTSNGNRVAIGYIAGGGAELAFSRHLSLKLEYNYLGFGKVNQPYSISLDPGLPTAAVLSGPAVSQEHEQIVRAGFNYRF